MKALPLIVLALSLAAAPSQAADPSPAKPAAVDSLALLERAVARDSSKFDNLSRLGLMYLERDRPNEAIRVLTRASKLKPKDSRVLVNLGVAFDGTGAAGMAQMYYKKALEFAPGDEVANCRLASSLYAEGKHSEAVSMLREVMQEQPRSHCAYFTMGVAFADAGIYREAIRMWRKVIELAPASQEAASARESIEVLEKFVGL